MNRVSRSDTAGAPRRAQSATPIPGCHQVPVVARDVGEAVRLALPASTVNPT
jgi:hypothetical protein